MKAKFRLLLVFTMFISICNGQVKSGKDVIQLMKEKYNNTYLKNLTFSQDVIEFENGTIANKTVWHEAYTYPHQLIIKDESNNGASGYVYNWDSLYIFNDHKIDTKLKRYNDLILLGFDIYEQPIEKTLKMLEEIGYDINKYYTTVANGNEVYCIGAETETDSLHKFYIDKNNLYLIGNVKYYESDVWETYFEDYEEINGNVIATRVLFYHNGELSMTEEYYNIQFPKEINTDIYNPYKYKEATW